MIELLLFMHHWPSIMSSPIIPSAYPFGVYESDDFVLKKLCSASAAITTEVALSGPRLIFEEKILKTLVRIPKAFSVTLRKRDSR